MLIRRKQIITSILIIMVAVAGYLNWAYQKNDSVTEVAVPLTVADRALGESALVSNDKVINDEATLAASDLKKIRQDKETSRSKSMEILKNVINNPDASRESKDKAQFENINIATSMEKEMVMEGILKTKGMTDAVVFINNGNVNVCVKSANPLDQPTIAKIQDAVTSNMQISVDKIRITQIK